MNFDFETLVDSADIDLRRSFQKDVTVMSGAQLHFKTAPCVIKALSARAQSGIYGWTGSEYPEYLEAVRSWMRDVRDWDIQIPWIVPTYGTLQAMCCAIRAFTQEGDGVIVQPPVYVLYDRVLSRTKRKKACNPLLLSDGQYRIDFENLERLMAVPENKLMLLCNPHNPIMSVWEKDDLDKIAALAKAHGVLVVVDEIFAEHVFSGQEIYPYAQVDRAMENCIICTSLGKAFNFTGMSHANMIIPDERIRSAFIAQRNTDHYGSMDPFMHDAVIAAYSKEGKEWINALLSYVSENIRMVKAFFSQHFPQVAVCRHQAGTLLWVDFRGLGLSEEELHRFLKEEAGILADKGSDYGEEGTGFCRIQLGFPKAELDRALQRLLAAGKKRGFAI